MSELPKAFLDEISEILGDPNEIRAFVDSFERQRVYGLRYNPLKCDKEAFLSDMPFSLTAVPWTDTGFYYSSDETPGKHPFHEAGAYYIQEPSAMSVADHLDAKTGDIICDLCAAPGGKSTQLATKMAGRGLLVANEIVPSRAKILSQNIERMGIRNAVVTNEPPERMRQIFPAFFDKILVDAPCSGEGMFRKNDEAITQWSEQNVQICAQRQRFILDQAKEMLKPGGSLLYSTCTFNRKEDEEVIAQFIKDNPTFHIEKLTPVCGQSEGLLAGTLRLWPHKLGGEGHFVAKLVKEHGPDVGMMSTAKDNVRGDVKKAYDAFAEAFFDKKPEGIFQAFGDHLSILPQLCPSLSGIKVVRAGLCLGTFKKNRFEPDHALALAMRKEDVQNYVEIKDGAKFIRGESLSLADDVISRKGTQDGWCVVAMGNYPIGIGKIVGNTIKNHYPKGLRIG